MNSNNNSNNNRSRFFSTISTIYNQIINNTFNTNETENQSEILNMVNLLNDEEKEYIREHNINQSMYDPIIDMLELLSPISRYSESEINKSKIYFNDIRESYLLDYNYNANEFDYSISDVLCLKICDYKKIHNVYPTFDEIMIEFYKDRCNCIYTHPPAIIKKVIKQCLLFKGDVPNCELYPLYVEYYTLHSKIPNEEELEEFVRRYIEFTRNPEDFHQKDKEFVPTLNIDKLPVFNYSTVDKNEIECCSICQDDFMSEQKVIQLKPCNHMFHYENKNCLDNGSIINWLEKNNMCPLCKTKIKAN